MRNKGIRGFTLFEMMISATILVFVFGAIASLFMSSLAALKAVGQFHQVYQEARQAMQWIDRDIKQSTSALASLSLDGKLYIADKDTLVLRRNTDTVGQYDYSVYDLVLDNKNYKGDDTYRLERTYYKTYSLAGIALAGSSVDKRIIANDVSVPPLSGYIFQTSGKKVSVDLTVEKLERKAKEQTVSLDGAAKTESGTSSDSTRANLRLVSEVKLRN